MIKQPNSSMCFVCGRDNSIGLHLHFFQDENDCVFAEFTPRAEHQGFPGVMHGGLVTALLDEVIGRTAIAKNFWCMTARLNVRIKKPIPIDAPVKIKGEVVNLHGRLLDGRGEIRLADGSLAAEAQGTFLKIPESQMIEYQRALQWWRVDE
ncbi:MAG: PaaI family thioesterase [Chloroflexi bacterium]|nr:PaaI family thioesterase [Chloroflexota bacterium]MBI3741099.1 PaaI family thioesterase [Chloroflexota bacterium]